MTARLVTPVLHPLDATVAVPGSKSIANRALVCAALADGTSTLRNVPDGDDTEAMLSCLALLGVAVRRAGTANIRAVVEGTAGHLRAAPTVLPARLAGTTSRFITAVCALGTVPYTVDGEPPLRARPMAPLHGALTALGANVDAEHRGRLPVTITGPLRGGPVELAGDISSQFVTALMLIGPYVPGGLRITLTSALVSRPYLEMTRTVMSHFGHDDVHIADSRIDVAPGNYAGREYEIEPDASSASYPLAAAAICGGRVEVPGLRSSSMQGDAAFCDVLASMGCTARRSELSTIVEGGETLSGVDIDMVGQSDLVPTLAAVATFATTPTRIRGVGFIRAKESDRLGDLRAELSRLGADAAETSDGLTIAPATLHGAAVDTHHDHRLAMAFGLIGLRVAGVEVNDAQVVSKSWPGYWEMLEGLR
ncbi:MAG TPA: 3-phosphoshikimate 1-carboxyvinyltransferase [Ilumatobacteraceae bacterium]|nr:3-phosphoshikimate 1-carboxyvinyltransferase [Ilumatobacteraceae bacterium]